MKSKRYIFLMLLSATILYSCKKDSTSMQNILPDNTIQPAITEPVIEVSTEPYQEKWEIVESGRCYCIEKMGL